MNTEELICRICLKVMATKKKKRRCSGVSVFDSAY